MMHAEDVCLLALSALGLQTLLDTCYNFSQSNDIIFNSLSLVCVVFYIKDVDVFACREVLSQAYKIN